MLQDVLHGAPLEVDAIVGQVKQTGDEAGVPCPAITTVLALLRGVSLAPRVEDAAARPLT